MMKAGILLALLLACGSSEETAPVSSRAVFSEPKIPVRDAADYYALEIKNLGHRKIITTRRVGPSSPLGSYARRECDCDDHTFRYLAEGDTLREFEQATLRQGDMEPAIGDSISGAICRYACR
jgi:hypothetical protein